MRSATIFAAAMAMASSVAAQATEGFAVFANPAKDEIVPAGKPYTLKWAAGKFSGPATLELIGGKTQNTQVHVADLAKLPEVGANQFVWNVDCSLGTEAVYGLTITLDSIPAGYTSKVFQWSNRFHIDNSGCGAQSSSAPASASASASASVSAAASATKPASESNYPTAAISSSAANASSAPVVTQSGSAYPTGAASVTPSLSTKASATASASASHSATTVPTAAAPKVAAGSFALAGVAIAAVLAF